MPVQNALESLSIGACLVAVDDDGQEIQIRSDQLEGNVQARQVAEQAQRNLRSTRLGRGSKNNETPLSQAMIELRSQVQSESEDSSPTEEVDHLPEDFDWKSLPRFVKLNAWDRTNPTWKKNLSRNDKHSEAVVLENHRMIKDAMAVGIHPYMVAFSRVNLLLELPFDTSQSYEMFQVPYKNLQEWSELQTPPGMMAVFKKSAIEAHAQAQVAQESLRSLPISLILDNLRNPDNMGTILRTAAGIGCREVLLTPGCVNPWQGKVMRAGAGAHFHVPITSKVHWERMHQLIPPYAQVVMADLEKFKPSRESQLDPNVLLGRIQELNDRCSDFHVPHRGESALRAGGMGETFDKRDVRNAKTLQGKELEEFLEEKVKVESEKLAGESRREAFYLDFSFNEPEILDEFQALPLITKEYHEFERFHNDQAIVVVIGGETQGISPQAIKFTHQYQGDRLYIPLRRSIESLNVASAASILLMEIQKKINLANKE
eukprot:TCALIF_01255-PA protein Name:"Similar to RNMTL1 RNA methyltransferase-like protein 1 (Homo sapiens)" AED:0.31 eAED:0.31 QI:0/0.33/0.5/0.75/0.66/0.75/4/446/487